jgi:hypothetical protein
MEQIGLRYTFGIPGVHNEKLIADNYVEAINMNGAQALMRTLVNAGIEVCFTNPGTSEMHFVAALDSAPCCACSKGWPRARPTAMHAWRTNLPPHSCTWAAASAMA